MTLLAGAESEWCANAWLFLVAAAAGTGGGAILTSGVRRLMDPLPGDAVRSRGVILTAAISAAVLWWWETQIGGILPEGAAPTPCTAAALRSTAHLILACFLAAATWIDLRHRVIPDAITVPGVVTGLTWNTLFPFTLLPITRAAERSFAPPLIESDVLGAFGGLGAASLPSWLGPSPAVSGLLAAGLLFVIWWWVGMPPAGTSIETDGPSPRTGFDSRWLVAAGGVAGIVTAWLIGGDHWTGLITALMGLAVSAGMIWATRAGASRALGREAMGFGDVTLMAMVGSWLGWQPCVLVCMFGVFIGLVHGVIQLLRHSESELPFGPSLCLATGLVVVCWKPLWSATSPQFAQPLELATVVALVIGLTAITLWGLQWLRAGRDA